MSTHLCRERAALGTVPVYTHKQQNPALAVQTAWPKPCYAPCLPAELRCSNRAWCRLCFSADCSSLQDKERTKSLSKTKIQKRERYHRRKRRGEPCSNGEDRGVLSQSPPGNAYSSQPSLRGSDVFAATVSVPGLQHTSGWRQAVTLRNGVSISKYRIPCLKHSQCVLKQDDSGQTAEQGECPAAAWTVIRYG